MGIPEEFQCDGGTQFTSHEFRAFAKSWGFSIADSSPRYPKSNGLAEKAVQTAKSIIKKCNEDGSSVELGLLNFRNTPRNEFLKSPNERILARCTRST